jgi:hypothetical protein
MVVDRKDRKGYRRKFEPEYKRRSGLAFGTLRVCTRYSHDSSPRSKCKGTKPGFEGKNYCIFWYESKNQLATMDEANTMQDLALALALRSMADESTLQPSEVIARG